MRKNENTLKEVFRRMFGNGPHRDKFLEAQIKSIWKEEMGTFIVERTSRIRFQSGVLIINLSSSVLRQELSMGREKLKSNLNSLLGEEFIREVKVF